MNKTNLTYLRDKVPNLQSRYGVYRDYTLNRTHSQTFRDRYHWRMDYKDGTIQRGGMRVNQLNCDRLAMAVCDKFGDLMKIDGFNNFRKDIRYTIHGTDKYGKLRIIRLSILNYNNKSWTDKINQYIIGHYDGGCRFPKCKIP